MKLAQRKQTANSQARPLWRTSRHAHGVCFGILQISPIRAHFPDSEAVLPGNRAALPGPHPASQTWCSVSAASSLLSANPHRNSAPSLGQSMTPRNLSHPRVSLGCWERVTGACVLADTYLGSHAPEASICFLSRMLSTSQASCRFLPGQPRVALITCSPESGPVSGTLCTLGFLVQFWLSHGTFQSAHMK